MLTHCNAGALATAGDYGTALGVIRGARDAGKRIAVIADETRPFLQGLRLTAWELAKDNIPVTVITDNMAGHVMKSGKVDCCRRRRRSHCRKRRYCKQDRHLHGCCSGKRTQHPFYVAAPITTLDLSLSSGDEIPIEERDIARSDAHRQSSTRSGRCGVHNPAFDVTPNELITAIITDKGWPAPYVESLQSVGECEELSGSNASERLSQTELGQLNDGFSETALLPPVDCELQARLAGLPEVRTQEFASAGDVGQTVDHISGARLLIVRNHIPLAS